MYNHKNMLIQKNMINLLCIFFISCLFSPAATWTISMWQPHPLASRTFIRHRGLCLTNAPRGALPGDLGTGFPKTLHEQFARNAEVHCNWSSLSMSKSSLFKGLLAWQFLRTSICWCRVFNLSVSDLSCLSSTGLCWTIAASCMLHFSCTTFESNFSCISSSSLRAACLSPEQSHVWDAL